MRKEAKYRALAFFIAFAVLLNWPVLRVFEGERMILSLPAGIFFITLFWIVTIVAAYSLSREKD